MRFGGGEFEDGISVQRARIEFLQAATVEVPALYHELLRLRSLLTRKVEDSPVEIVEFLQNPAATKLMVAPATQAEEYTVEAGKPVTGPDGKRRRAAWTVTHFDQMAAMATRAAFGASGFWARCRKWSYHARHAGFVATTTWAA
jgi:hypothetical protein